MSIQDRLYQIVSQLSDDPIFLVFFWLITLVAVASSVFYSKLPGEKAHVIEQIRIIGPSAVLSLAILGTFSGILIGLFGLENATFGSTIDKREITNLIDGLKVAFGTSVYCLIVSLFMKMYFVAFRRGDVFKDDTRTVDDLFNVLSELKDSIEKFTGDMGDKTVNALMEAIQKVMDEFNAKINDRLGEDFNALSDAVKDLNIWQDNYRHIVQTQTEELGKQTEGLKQAERSLTNIQQSMINMPEVTSQLAEIIDVMDTQTKDLNSRLEAFAEMKDKATSAFPLIEEKLNNLTLEIDKAIKNVIDGMQKTTEGMDTAMKNVVDGMQKTTEGMNEAMQGQKDKMFDAFSDLNESLSQSSDNAQKSFVQQQEMLSSMGENLKQHITDTSSSLKEVGSELKQAQLESVNLMEESLLKQMDELKGRLTEVTTLTVEQLGGKLASLSKKFVEDYTPLTIELQKLIELSKDIKKQD